MQKIKNVLLVDDDPASNFLTQLLLEDMDIVEQISVTTNGKEALDYVKAHCGQNTCPDLILLDINMPLMNGFEFLDHFQHLPVDHPIQVVMLTSSASPKDVEKAQSYKISDFVNKPLTEEKLQSIFDKR
jgi:CheY-like chemotaxis protein